MEQLTSSSQVFGDKQIGVGIVGGFFKFKNDPNVYGISNNHVIAKLNNCRKGDPVFIPSDDDDPTVVGSLQCWVTLDTVGINHLDVALFKLESGSNYSWLMPAGVQAPQDPVAPVLNGPVYFVRPDGSKRPGKINNPSVGYNIDLTLAGKTFTFIDLIEIVTFTGDPFSTDGDSGSIIFNDTNNVIGLLLGANSVGTKSYAVPFVNGKFGITGTYEISIAKDLIQTVNNETLNV